MDIANLLAQGTRARPAGMEQNALMQGQEMQQRQMQNALMQYQMQSAMRKDAADQQAAAQLMQWRNALQVPQGEQYAQQGRPAMNAAQAESAVGTPGYGMSSAQDQVRTMPADPRMVQAVQLAKAGQMSPMDLFKIQNPERKLMGVKADETVIDERTGQQVFSGSPKAEKPPSAVQEYQFAVGQGYKGTFEQWDTTRKKAGAASVSVNTGQKGYENESKLRNDFKSEPIYKDFQDMDQAYKQIKAGLSSKTPIGDVAAATKIMKLLDPGSVVRESELAIAMAAAGKLDRLQNYVQMKISGESLTPKQRQDFESLAGELHAAAGQAYNKKRTEYAAMGQRYQLDPSVIGGEYVPPNKAKAQPQAGSAPKAGDVVDGYRFKGGNPADKANWERK